MNDYIPPVNSLSHQDDENRLTAEVFEEFHEALDILYIKGNLSGRLKFLEKWPVPAKLIFGEELIGFDHDGVSDLERRSILEDEAEVRRLDMLEIAQTLEEKSVDRSALQIEYVEPLIKELGRDLALLFYSPKIVNRFLPLSPEAAALVEVEVEQTKEIVSSDDSFNAGQDDIAALADEIVPDIENRGAPVASNPIVDEPEDPNIKRPTLPDPDESLDSVEPISVEPPQQNPVPDDLQQEAMQQNPQVDDTPEENVFLGRDPYAPEPDPLPPPPPSPSTEQQAPPPADPAQQDLTKQSVHKALDDIQPIDSQKMTFVPAKSPDAPSKDDKGAIPVIGGAKEKPQDDGL